jgi:pimeloyl-ACP methyl ester carboxylesterase
VKFKRILGVAALIIVIGVGGYAANYMYKRQERLSPADPAALSALKSSSAVKVTAIDWYIFEPVNTTPTTGFIFYPGGECDERGYAELMHAIAAEGYLVVLVPMPLQLAVLAPNEAEDVIATFPEIKSWAIGGHSLGGAMAARFIYTHPGTIDGLLFWDAYPPKTDDISERDIAVRLIHRSDESGEPPDYYEEYKPLLPANMEYRPMPGAIHINFGRFIAAPRFQTDQPPELDIDSQHQLIVKYTADFLANL